MQLTFPTCTVREWRSEDLASLVRHANNRNVSIHLRDRFPYPYLENHARQFLDHVAGLSPPTHWAIEVDGEAAGGIGLERLTDVERVSAELGYWLGEEHWGRGIVTNAVRAVTSEVFELFDLTRIFALPFADNAGSIRVLEKAGFVLEGRMRQSAIKEGRLRDQLLFAKYKDLIEPRVHEPMNP